MSTAPSRVLSPLSLAPLAGASGSVNSPEAATRYKGALTFETGGGGGNGACIEDGLIGAGGATPAFFGGVDSSLSFDTTQVDRMSGVWYEKPSSSARSRSDRRPAVRGLVHLTVGH